MHDVETIFHLSYVLTASENLFLNMSDARETAKGKILADHKINKLRVHGFYYFFVCIIIYCCLCYIFFLSFRVLFLFFFLKNHR